MRSGAGTTGSATSGPASILAARRAALAADAARGAGHRAARPDGKSTAADRAPDPRARDRRSGQAPGSARWKDPRNEPALCGPDASGAALDRRDPAAAGRRYGAARTLLGPLAPSAGTRPDGMGMGAHTPRAAQLSVAGGPPHRGGRAQGIQRPRRASAVYHGGRPRTARADRPRPRCRRRGVERSRPRPDRRRAARRVAHAAARDRRNRCARVHSASRRFQCRRCRRRQRRLRHSALSASAVAGGRAVRGSDLCIGRASIRSGAGASFACVAGGDARARAASVRIRARAVARGCAAPRAGVTHAGGAGRC